MEAKTICAHCGAHAEGRPPTCPSCGYDPRVAATYRLEEVLGKGGQGVAWRARKEPSGEPVCLKELRWANMGSLDDERRFAREGDLLSGLTHPAIPRHHGAFAWGEGRAHALYIAQELVVGESLESERRRRGYVLAEVVGIGIEVAGVLDYLHARRPSIVHRDIKPSNLMRRVDGKIVLVDFGAARLIGLGGASQMSVAGTFGFMAPEQIRGEAGAPSDVYGLGMTLLVLLAGGEPEALLDEMNRPDPGRVRGLSPALLALLREMVAVRPEERPSAAEVAKRLVAFREGRAEVAPVKAAASPVRPEVLAMLEQGAAAARPGRAPAIAAFSGALVVAGVAAAVFGAMSPFEGQASFEEARLAHEQAVAESEARRKEEERARKLAERDERDTRRGAVPGGEEEAGRSGGGDGAGAPSVSGLSAAAQATPVDKVMADLSRCREGQTRACRDVTNEVRREVVVEGWPEPMRAVCEAGVAEACHELALVFAQGVGGVEPSRIETRRYFAASCELGHLDGCGSAGRMAMKGDGGRADGGAAVVAFEKACGGGDKDSCVNLGAVLAEGLGGAKVDRARALGIFAELCGERVKLGCENAEAMIGNGWGLGAGKERVAGFERMCDQRVGLACLRLAGMAASGSGGVKRDAERAKALYTRGCDLGNAESCEKL